MFYVKHEISFNPHPRLQKKLTSLQAAGSARTPITNQFCLKDMNNKRKRTWGISLGSARTPHTWMRVNHRSTYRLGYIHKTGRLTWIYFTDFKMTCCFWFTMADFYAVRMRTPEVLYKFRFKLVYWQAGTADKLIFTQSVCNWIGKYKEKKTLRLNQASNLTLRVTFWDAVRGFREPGEWGPKQPGTVTGSLFW